MSNLGSTDDKFQPPNQLGTEELREILRLDLDSFDEGADSDHQDYIFRVMEVLELRERSTATASQAKLEEAWTRFLAQNPSFLPQQSPAEHNSTLCTEPRSSNNQNKKPVRRMQFARILVASMLTIVLFGTVTASAFNINLFAIIGQWTQELFHLGETSEERVEEGLHEKNLLPRDKLVAALDQSSVKEQLVPRWFPDGFTCAETGKEVLPDRTVFFSSMETEDGLNISITITQYITLPENLLTDYEKSNTSVERYEAAGITHYILYNYDKAVISWLLQSFEISITGDITKKEAREIIDSIYEET